MRYLFMGFLLVTFTAVLSPSIHGEESVGYMQQLKILKQQYRHEKQQFVRLNTESSGLQWLGQQNGKHSTQVADLQMQRQQRLHKTELSRLSQEIERLELKLHRAEQSVNR